MYKLYYFTEDMDFLIFISESTMFAYTSKTWYTSINASIFRIGNYS